MRLQLISATLLWLGANARNLPLPEEMLKELTTTEPGNTTCPGRLRPYCCYSLDFSEIQVECIGPGRVENLEKCLDYDPRPMCCCALDRDAWKPGEPDWIPRAISCDKDCQALDAPDEASHQFSSDL